MTDWEETPANVIALLEDGETRSFGAYSDAVVGHVALRLFETALGGEQRFERKMRWAEVVRAKERSGDVEAALKVPENLKGGPLPRKFWQQKRGEQRRAFQRRVDRGLKAQKQLPEYFDKVRTLLRSYMEAWLAAGKNSARLLALDPVLDRQIEKCLELSRPVFVPLTPAKLRVPPMVGRSPALEATRLFLVVLTSEDAKLVRRCANEKCTNIFMGRPNRKFCGRTCLEKNFSGTKTFLAKRKKYMAARRERDLDELIARAAKSPAKGILLVNELNRGLSDNPLKHETYSGVTLKWLNRYQKTINRRRKS